MAPPGRPVMRDRARGGKRGGPVSPSYDWRCFARVWWLVSGSLFHLLFQVDGGIHQHFPSHGNLAAWLLVTGIISWPNALAGSPTPVMAFSLAVSGTDSNCNRRPPLPPPPPALALGYIPLFPRKIRLPLLALLSTPRRPCRFLSDSRSC